MSYQADVRVSYTSINLPNNIRLDVFEKKNAPVYLKVGLLCGDALQQNSIQGIAHFLEHVLVAGTKQFPSKDKIALYLDQYGGSFGAETNSERLFLTFSVASREYAHELFYIASEVLRNSLFSEQIIETERGAILSEYKGKYSKTDHKINKRFSEVVFNNTPYQVSALGDEESIRCIQKEHLLGFLGKNLVGGKMGVVVAGDISAQEAVSLSEHYFGTITYSSGERIDIAKQEPLPEFFDTSHQVSFIGAPHEDSASIKIGLRIPGFYHEYFYHYILINTILGGSRGSILNTKLRYDLGLVYSAYSLLQYNSRGGYFAIQTACSHEHTARVAGEILKLLRSDLSVFITQERFEIEKKRWLLRSKTEKESAKSWLEFGSPQILTTANVDFDSFINNIENLTYETTVRALAHMFSNKNIYLVYSGKNELSISV